MKYTSRLVLSCGLLLLVIQAKAEPSIPILHSIAVQQNSIVFTLTSHGCSKDADFELRVKNEGSSITLLRTRVDRCKRAPMVFQVKRSLNEAGLSLQIPFAVRNLFAPPPVKHQQKPRYK